MPRATEVNNSERQTCRLRRSFKAVSSCITSVVSRPSSLTPPPDSGVNISISLQRRFDLFKYKLHSGLNLSPPRAASLLPALPPRCGGGKRPRQAALKDLKGRRATSKGWPHNQRSLSLSISPPSAGWRAHLRAEPEP